MKIIYREELPKCDFCQKPAIYDAPTCHGSSWANMCENCFKVHKGMSAQAVGYKFAKRDIAKPVTDAKIHMGLEEQSEGYDLHTIYDGVREIKCPGCGDMRSVEPDARYKYNCEACGIKVQVPEGMF